MKNTQPIKKNKDFKNAYAKGVSVVNRLLVLYVLPNGLDVNCLGITAGKKVGGAVARNRVKRLIKESYRLTEGRVAVGYSLVVVARAAAGKLPREGSFTAVDTALKALLTKQGLLAK